MNIFNFPNEILLKIIINIKNINKYKSISRDFNNLIKLTSEYFNNKFTKMYSNWHNNKTVLIKKIIKNNNLDDLIFLYNNYDIEGNMYDIIFFSIKYENSNIFLWSLNFNRDIINNAISYYINANNTKKLEWLITNNISVNTIAKIAAKNNNKYIIKWAVKHGANIIYLKSHLFYNDLS